MSIPTIPDAPPVQQFDLIPLRSMGDEAVFEAACNDFWPRVKPFAEDLTAAGDWIGTVYIAMGEAYQLTAQAAATATTKAGEAAGSAQSASESADRVEQLLAVLPEGTLDDTVTGEDSTWSSVKIDAELDLKADLIGGKVPIAQLPDTGISSTLTKTFGAGEQYIIVTPSSTDAPILGVTKEVPQIGVTTNQWETAVSEQSMTVQAGLQFGASGLEVDLTGGTYVGEYLSAVTSSSINTDFWTDINSMISDDADNSEFISYALSDDGRNTFYVVRANSGSRPVARDNSSVWEINQAPEFEDVDWVAATTNEMESAISEAQGIVKFGFDLNTLSYDTSLTSLPGSQPRATAFSADGTAFYYASNSTDRIYQLDLSVAYDIGTAVNNNKSISVGSQDAVMTGIALSEDGSKMFLLGFQNKRIYEYTISTVGDLNTAVYTGQSFSLSAQIGTSQPFGLELADDDSKFYVQAVNLFYQYNMTTAATLSTATYSGFSFDVSSTLTGAVGVVISKNGKYFFTAKGNTTSGAGVFRFTLTTPFRISSAVYDNNNGIIDQGLSLGDIAISEDGGTLVARSAATDAFFQYRMDLLSTNSMVGSQLAETTDADFPAVTTTLDLAITLRTEDGGATPTTSGVSINYDANTADEISRHVTDYKVQKLSDTELRFEAVTSGNYKVRVI